MKCGVILSLLSLLKVCICNREQIQVGEVMSQKTGSSASVILQNGTTAADPVFSSEEPYHDHQKGNNSDHEPPTTTAVTPDNYLDRVYIYWHYLGGVVCTAISFIGFGGNIVTVIVLSSPEMKSSTSIFLILLAMFDSCLLVSNLIFTGLKWLLFYTVYYTSYVSYFMMPALPVMYALSSIAHTGSIYIVVAVNVERYIAVCHPLKAALFCTISRAKKTCMVVVVICILYNIPRYFETYLKWDWVPEFNQTMLVVDNSDMAYTYWYLTVYLVYINVIVKFVIPGVLLVVLNAIMVRKLYRTKPNLQKQERKGSEKERFTAMVLAVVVVFLVSLAAACLELIMYEVNSAISLEECSEICGYVSGVSQIAVVINSSVNFILFCFFGRKFRGVFVNKFLSCCRR